MPAVADAHPRPAAMLPALKATVTTATGIGQDADHPVSGAHTGDPFPHVGHPAGQLVPQNDPRVHAAPQHPGHNQQVMVAEPAGRHLHQSFSRLRDGHRQVFYHQIWGEAGLFHY